MAAARLLAVAATALGARACGFTTHTTIAHRAINHFWLPGEYPGWGLMVAQRPDYVYGGAPYPDYLYQCGSNHDGELPPPRSVTCGQT